jgi:hypothetical protein
MWELQLPLDFRVLVRIPLGPATWSTVSPISSHWWVFIAGTDDYSWTLQQRASCVSANSRFALFPAVSWMYRMFAVCPFPLFCCKEIRNHHYVSNRFLDGWSDALNSNNCFATLVSRIENFIFQYSLSFCFCFLYQQLLFHLLSVSL